MSQTLWFFFAFVIVLALIGLAAWLVRRFGGGNLGSSANRGRMPRLAVIDAAAVDGRRRLVLVRRDNVEHLLMIGGPADLVVEPNIVRGAPQRDQAPPVRPPERSCLPVSPPTLDGRTAKFRMPIRSSTANRRWRNRSRARRAYLIPTTRAALPWRRCRIVIAPIQFRTSHLSR